MKVRFLVSFLCVFLFYQWQVVADVKRIKSNPVILKGELIDPPTGIKSEPVVATLSKFYLEVAFNHTLGNLTVSVVNQQEVVVYQQTVKATAGSGLDIGTGSWSNGVYTLLITDGIGGCLEGEFELDR